MKRMITMMKEVSFDKLVEVSQLRQGDKVKLTNGETAEFIRLKQKKFLGVMDGKSYNIPVNMFVEVLEKADQKAKVEKADHMTLKQNEPFYINKSGNALLFYFVKMENSRIVGINPITNATTRIDASMYAGKVSNTI
jgi:hypothetical protein